MTKDSKAKRDARARQASTGEPYVVARRNTTRPGAHPEPIFRTDRCANCDEPLLDTETRSLYCSELCTQTAETIRYWRRIVRDGRIDDPDVALALRTRVAHLLAGGYAARARHLSQTVRDQVRHRDNGRCRSCGAPGTEIDHIATDSPELDNLQLLCASCHQNKTALRMEPASAEQTQMIDDLYRRRVEPEQPLRLCDDQDRWPKEWRKLQSERKIRLTGCAPPPAEDYDDIDIDDVDDYRALGIDDDSGYGPDSYFVHAMAKDD